MNPKLLFWVPGAAAAGADTGRRAASSADFSGLVAGLAVALCAALALVVMQLGYL